MRIVEGVVGGKGPVSVLEGLKRKDGTDYLGLLEG